MAAPEATVPAATRVRVPAPEAFFGFRMGDDGRLAGWQEITNYFRAVADASDRVDLVEFGETTEGQRFVAAVVSAPENLARLDEIRAANLALADPRRIDPEAATALVAGQKAIVAIGASIHAEEIGATQTANELLHELATSEDPAWLTVLRETVVLVLPSLNPDGHRIVMDWYDRTRGTAFEGAPLPWLYQKYAGHDINRDAFMMNLAENRSLSAFFYRQWHPHVFVTLHQMGPRGPRFFVPPNYDPIHPNSDPLIWRTAGLLGSAMSLGLERAGKSGVVSNALYDYYWPGYEDSAPIGHNVVCMLTEAASVKLAWPVDVPASELAGSPRGLPGHYPQVNFPNPWPGGRWRLRDIVDYELIAVRGLLDAVARYRREVVAGFYEMGRRAVERGGHDAPFAFLIPQDQHDPHAAHRLVSALLDGAVEVHRAVEPFRIGTRDYPAGTELVLMAQPYRAYAKTLLERQSYPVRKTAAGGAAERPYDVTGWTLPLQMGVSVETIAEPFELPVMTPIDRATLLPAQVWGERRPSYYLVDARGSGGALAVNRLLAAGVAVSWTNAPVEALGYRYAPGTLVVKHSKETRAVVDAIAKELGLRATALKGALPSHASRIGGARVGLYRPWVDGIDEGWTRWVLERYGFAYRNLGPADVKAGGLRQWWDAIVVPDMRRESLVDGRPAGTVPDQYVGGLGQTGLAALRDFVIAGGTLICLDSSCQPILDAMAAPVTNALAALPADQFQCPGSILRLDVDPSSHLVYGMPAENAAFLADGAAYLVKDDAGASAQVKIAARYGASDPLLSGWLHGADHVAGKGAALEWATGQGRLVVIGFRAQHRGQSLATFRVLFNALFAAPALREP